MNNLNNIYMNFTKDKITTDKIEIIGVESVKFLTNENLKSNEIRITTSDYINIVTIFNLSGKKKTVVLNGDSHKSSRLVIETNFRSGLEIKITDCNVYHTKDLIKLHSLNIVNKNSRVVEGDNLIVNIAKINLADNATVKLYKITVSLSTTLNDRSIIDYSRYEDAKTKHHFYGVNPNWSIRERRVVKQHPKYIPPIPPVSKCLIKQPFL